MRLRSNNPVYNRILNSDEYRSYAGEYEAATYGGVARKRCFSSPWFSSVLSAVFG